MEVKKFIMAPEIVYHVAKMVAEIKMPVNTKTAQREPQTFSGKIFCTTPALAAGEELVPAVIKKNKGKDGSCSAATVVLE